MGVEGWVWCRRASAQGNCLDLLLQEPYGKGEGWRCERARALAAGVCRVLASWYFWP